MRKLVWAITVSCLWPGAAMAQAHLTDDRACRRHHGPADCVDGWTVCADSTSTHFRCWEHSLSDPTPSHRQAFVSRSDLMEMRMRMPPARQAEDHEHQQGVEMLAPAREAIATCLPNRADFGVVIGDDDRVFYRAAQNGRNESRPSTTERNCLHRAVLAAMAGRHLRHAVLVWLHELPTAAAVQDSGMVEDRKAAAGLRRMGL